MAVGGLQHASSSHVARAAGTASGSSLSSKGTRKIKHEIPIENEQNREACHWMGRKRISITGKKEGRPGGNEGGGREGKAL